MNAAKHQEDRAKHGNLFLFWAHGGVLSSLGILPVSDGLSLIHWRYLRVTCDLWTVTSGDVCVFCPAFIGNLKKRIIIIVEQASRSYWYVTALATNVTEQLVW